MLFPDNLSKPGLPVVKSGSDYIDYYTLRAVTLRNVCGEMKDTVDHLLSAISEWALIALYWGV